MQQHHTVSLIVALSAVVLFGGAGCFNRDAKENANRVAPPAPTVSASPQTITNGNVVIEEAYAFEPGWVTIHTDNNGEPGADIGHAAVPTGRSTDITVPIDAAKATPVLYVMLHDDKGAIGSYEFPGTDTPTLYLENMVYRDFTVTNPGVK